MPRITSTHIIAAALTIVGAAGILFSGLGFAASPGTGSASDDWHRYSIGTVPPPRQSGPAPTDPEPPLTPDPSKKQTLVVQGKLTSGIDPGVPLLPTQAPPAAIALPSESLDEESPAPAPANPGIAPAWIEIPRAGVDAPVTNVGTTSDGAMEAPADYSDVGWWSQGTRPGAPGKAVMAGHVDSLNGPSVFHGLRDLVPGDEIIVSDGGTELRFIVRGAALYRVDEAPLEDIFGPSVDRELVLITCGGSFDRRSASYLHRLVVFAVLAESDPPPLPGAGTPG